MQNSPVQYRPGNFGNPGGPANFSNGGGPGNYGNGGSPGHFPNPGSPANFNGGGSPGSSNNFSNGGGSPGNYGNSSSSNCPDCPKPRPHDDSQEVVHTTQDVDQSRVINTQSVVPVAPRMKETNHLVIRHNTIRNVGVVRHNHTIIEKEIRYRRRPIYKRPVMVKYVTQHYQTVYKPAIVYVPYVYPVRYSVPYYYYPKQYYYPQHYYQQH